MVERNGLEHRGREQKFAFWTSLVIGFFFLSFFVAPFTIEKGTTGDLSGNANLFDYVSDDGGSWGSGGNQKAGPHEHEDGEIVEHSAFAWSELNIYAAIIYGFGDLNCHQKHERSWILNENQEPYAIVNLSTYSLSDPSYYEGLKNLFIGAALGNSCSSVTHPFDISVCQ